MCLFVLTCHVSVNNSFTWKFVFFFGGRTCRTVFSSPLIAEARLLVKGTTRKLFNDSPSYCSSAISDNYSNTHPQYMYSRYFWFSNFCHFFAIGRQMSHNCNFCVECIFCAVVIQPVNPFPCCRVRYNDYANI